MLRASRLAPSILALAACQRAPVDPRPEPPIAAAPSAASPLPSPTTPVAATAAPPPSSSAPPPAPEVAPLAAEEAFVLRGARGPGRAVLLGGQCAQPQYYLDAIKEAAGRRYQIVALRGDKPCFEAFRGWAFDIPALDRRIERVFSSLGLGEPRDVLVIGYSQGASVAVQLAAHAPERYTRFVLMAQPREPSPAALARARGIVTMAGTRDRQDLMQRGARKLEAAGLRARYVPLPGAPHGYMGDDPEGTFERVFGWLDG